jgi:hypothetical protein
MENIMMLPQKLQIGLPYDSAVPFMDTCHPKSKAVSQRDICVSVFTAALFPKETQMSIKRRIHKQNVVYLHNVKEEGNFGTGYNMYETWRS